MDKSTLAALHEDSDFFTDLGNGVWLMDDHRWAFYIWEKFRKQSGIQRFSLVHADYHWDGVNDFAEQLDEVRKLISADEIELFELVRKNKLIRYDSFIAPAVLRGMFEEVHFYCAQDDGDDVGLDESLLQLSGCIQRVHQDILSLVTSQFSTPLIFDLCLDLFNRSNDKEYEGDIWRDDEIYRFLDSTYSLIEHASIVTISLSFGYSGTVEDTRRLAGMVIPKVMDSRR